MNKNKCSCNKNKNKTSYYCEDCWKEIYPLLYADHGWMGVRKNCIFCRKQDFRLICHACFETVPSLVKIKESIIKEVSGIYFFK